MLSREYQVVDGVFARRDGRLCGLKKNGETCEFLDALRASNRDAFRFHGEVENDGAAVGKGDFRFSAEGLPGFFLSQANGIERNELDFLSGTLYAQRASYFPYAIVIGPRGIETKRRLVDSFEAVRHAPRQICGEISSTGSGKLIVVLLVPALSQAGRDRLFGDWSGGWTRYDPERSSVVFARCEAPEKPFRVLNISNGTSSRFPASLDML